MGVRRELGLTELTPQSFAPYGALLGKPMAEAGGVSAFASPKSDFWREHLFAAGGADPEILWVAYRDADPRIDRLEAHLLTEQAVVPLTGDIIQIVAVSTPTGAPDMDSLRAFRVPAGKGLCMRSGCWHATRVPSGEVKCLMLTRATTTADLVAHLTRGAPLVESAFSDVSLMLEKLVGGEGIEPPTSSV